jgi:hypothetical protein
MSRHLMEPDPDAVAPPLAFFLWLIALGIGFVLALSLVAPND